MGKENEPNPQKATILLLYVEAVIVSHGPTQDMARQQGSKMLDLTPNCCPHPQYSLGQKNIVK